MQQQQQQQYPERIKISGLPFWEQGWNTIFYKTKLLSCDRPVYRLDTYKLYGLIPISGVTIRLCIAPGKPKWWFIPDNDLMELSISFSNAELLGQWGYVTVSPLQDNA